MYIKQFSDECIDNIVHTYDMVEISYLFFKFTSCALFV